MVPSSNATEARAAKDAVLMAASIDLSSSHPEDGRMKRTTIGIFGDSLDFRNGCRGR
jgi:hypothetical protein